LWRYHLRPLPLSFAYPCACLHRPLPGLTTSDLHGLGCAVQVSHATLSVSLLPLACRCVMGGCRQIPVQNTLSPDGTRMRDTNTCLYALCLWTPTNFTTTCVELCVGPAFLTHACALPSSPAALEGEVSYGRKRESPEIFIQGLEGGGGAGGGGGGNAGAASAVLTSVDASGDGDEY